jgi:transposase
VSQWAEIRHMHLVEGVAKRVIARRLRIDIKTVRRALRREQAPAVRESPPRGRRLELHRELVELWLRDEPSLTAKRIGRLLRPHAGTVPERTLREFVALVRGQVFRPEAFVHRTHVPGMTMEADFGESFAVIAGVLRRIKFLVATLPCSNVYFARAYPVERLECLLDGLEQAFRYFGGVPQRCVLDNTSLAVREVLVGTDRVETRLFHAFRGGYPFAADFCAPAKGWEKGSVEAGVRYVRNNVFRPRPEVATFDELNAMILAELEQDLDTRRLPDGRTVREAFLEERAQLRPLPVHAPETCRVLAKVADKFGRIRIDRSHYSVPIEHAYRPVTCKLFHDRVVIATAGHVVATHVRSFEHGTQVIEPRHVLRLLERKYRAIAESTAIQQWALPPVFEELRERLRREVRKPDREWVGVLRLLEEHGEEDVEAAVKEALVRGTPRLESVRLLLRRASGNGLPPPLPAPVARLDLAAITVAVPDLAEYDSVGGRRS